MVSQFTRSYEFSLNWKLDQSVHSKLFLVLLKVMISRISQSNLFLLYSIKIFFNKRKHRKFRYLVLQTSKMTRQKYILFENKHLKVLISMESAMQYYIYKQLHFVTTDDLPTMYIL